MCNQSVDLSHYSESFQLAYSLVTDLIKSGNADTATLPECLAGLIKVISAEKVDSADSQAHRTEKEPQA